MVTTAADCEEVTLGKQGIIEGAKPGAVVVDMATISPLAVRRIASALAERGIEPHAAFIDYLEKTYDDNMSLDIPLLGNHQYMFNDRITD